MKAPLILVIATSVILSAPQISVDNSKFDFGVVPAGDGKLTHTFKITNTGDETLKIQKVKPGCSCTVVDFDPVVEPGETSEITAALKLSGRNGPQNKPITVISNSEVNPILRLSLKAYIMGPINMNRAYAIYEPTKTQEMISDSIGITSTMPNLEIKEAYFSYRDTEKEKQYPVKVTLIKEREENGVSMYTMSFSFSPELSKDPAAGTIFFSTTHPEKELIQFRCMIEGIRE